MEKKYLLPEIYRKTSFKRNGPVANLRYQGPKNKSEK
jgi:hypothetical protein